MLIACGVSLLACTSAVHADTVTIAGATADYAVSAPPGTAALVARNGIGSETRELGVFRETAAPPTGRQYSESRAIFQFDLSLLGLATISNATFSIYYPAQNSAFPTHAADLWGSANRSSLVQYTDAGAINEFDAGDYALVASTAVPRFASGSGGNPADVNRRYESSISAYLQARHAAYLADNTQRYVFLRMQVAPNVFIVNSFYELSSGESATPPQIIVTGEPMVLVPLPMSVWAGGVGLMGVGSITALRRRCDRA